MRFYFYLLTILLRHYLAVLLVLLALFGLLELVDQLDEVGKGRFRMADALLHALLVLPRRGLDLTPVAVLLGAVLALNQLAQHSEWIAMQAAGLSRGRLRRWVLMIVATAAPVWWFAEEFIAPPLEQFARHRQASAIQGNTAPGLSGNGGLLDFINLDNLLYGAVPAQIDITDQGLWARSDTEILHIRQLNDQGQPQGVDLYRFDNQLRLIEFFRAAGAVVSENGPWELQNVLYKSLQAADMKTTHLMRYDWRGFIDLQALRATAIRRLSEPPPSSLSITTLWQRQTDLAAQAKPTLREALAFWQKLGLPLTTIALTACVLPFASGMPRDGSGGRRLLCGALLGVGFYLGNQIMAGVGLVAQWPAPVIALLLPTVLLVISGWFWRWPPQ